MEEGRSVLMIAGSDGCCQGDHKQLSSMVPFQLVIPVFPHVSKKAVAERHNGFTVVRECDRQVDGVYKRASICSTANRWRTESELAQKVQNDLPLAIPVEGENKPAPVRLLLDKIDMMEVRESRQLGGSIKHVIGKID